MKYVFKAFSSLIFTENCCWNLTFLENMTLWPSLYGIQKWAGMIKNCYLAVNINLFFAVRLSLDFLARISISFITRGGILSYMIKIFVTLLFIYFQLKYIFGYKPSSYVLIQNKERCSLTQNFQLLPQWRNHLKQKTYDEAYN